MSIHHWYLTLAQAKVTEVYSGPFLLTKKGYMI